MLEVVEKTDEVWGVGPFEVRVPDRTTSARTVLQHATLLLHGPGPWPVRLVTAAGEFEVFITSGGGVELSPRFPAAPEVWRWLLPDDSLILPVEQIRASAPVQETADDAFGAADRCVQPDRHRVTEGGRYCLACGRQRPFGATAESQMFIGAHAGAGTSTWASLLGGVDLGARMPPQGRVVAVARSTPAGLARLKVLMGDHGVGRFSAALVVADAPGRILPAASREIRIIKAGLPVTITPWIPALRGAHEAPLNAGPLRRPVARVRQSLQTASRIAPLEPHQSVRARHIRRTT